jgi:uncharacterized protein YdeI (YjbR/CyaY-like superfamily)
MPSLDTSQAIHVAAAEDFDHWLESHRDRDRDVVVAIHKRSSGRQTVTFEALQEVALCHGWVDTQTKSIDDERYAIRFVPRRPGSAWSPTNRAMARRLLAVGRVTDRGRAVLPDDLETTP